MQRMRRAGATQHTVYQLTKSSRVARRLGVDSIGNHFDQIIGHGKAVSRALEDVRVAPRRRGACAYRDTRMALAGAAVALRQSALAAVQDCIDWIGFAGLC